MSVQVIKKDGRPEWAVLPYQEYERLRSAAEDADDVRRYDEVMTASDDGSQDVPGELIRRLVNGENPVKAWREHRGLKQNEVARQVGISNGYLSHIESGRKES